MFTKDSVVLADLISLSRIGICFVDTHDNSSIPINDCDTEETEEGLWVTGTDKISNREVKILASSIKGFTNFTNPLNASGEEHYIIRKTKSEYETIKKECDLDGVELNLDIFYQDIPTHEKTISMHLNKRYDQVSLDELKTFWKSCIEKRCSVIENEIISELESEAEGQEIQTEELDTIKNIFNNIKSHEEILGINTKEELLSFWPAILTPAPRFVKP